MLNNPIILKRIISISITVLVGYLALFNSACYPSKLPQIEAEKIANARIEKYAKDNRLPADDFSRIRVEYFEQAKAWQIVFHSKSNSSLLISILVDNFRNVELHEENRSSLNSDK